MDESQRLGSRDDASGRPICAAAACAEPTYALGKCKYHYHKDRRESKVVPKSGHWGKWKGVGCSVEGCEEPAYAKGLCVSHYNKQMWATGARKRSADKNRDAHLKHRYGISLEEYNQRLVEQDGKCAICLRPPGPDNTPPNWKGKLGVDHCHRRGAVRALLCNSCNLIVNEGNTEETLLRAIEYLRTHTGSDSINNG